MIGPLFSTEMDAVDMFVAWGFISNTARDLCLSKILVASGAPILPVPMKPAFILVSPVAACGSNFMIRYRMDNGE